jgi:peptidoglycan hydrolase-like protein with peptidoglycan-binding domain
MLIAVVLFSFNSLYTTKVSAAAQVVTTPKVAADVNSSCPPTQNKGANNDWVKVIQYKLNSLENNDVVIVPNYPLATDGSFGPNTYNAVVSFQNQSGLTPDGSVGPLTWSMMGLCTVGHAHVPSGYTYGGNYCPPTQNEGDNNTFVNALQHMVTETAYYFNNVQTSPNSGWYPLSTDGSFGPNTLKGVENFQASNGLPADGSVGPLTWGAMGMCY